MPIVPSVLLMASLLAADGPRPGSGVPRSAPTDGLTAAARKLVEPGLRATLGYGLASFSCDAPAKPSPGSLVDCRAVDERGVASTYVFAVDEQPAVSLRLATFPPSRLPDAKLAELEVPARSFLEAALRTDWAAAHAALHPSARAKYTAEDVRREFDLVAQELGRLRSATRSAVSIRTPGLLELVYTLAFERGSGRARLWIEREGTALFVAGFVVGAEPGTPAHARLADNAFRELVAKVVAEPVRSVAVPLEKLATVGDDAVGTATLASGHDLAVRFRRSGRDDDLEPEDFQFRVVDSPWLVRALLSGRSLRAASVECPSRVLAEGSSQACRVALQGGGTLSVTIRHDAAGHDLVAVEELRP